MTSIPRKKIKRLPSSGKRTRPEQVHILPLAKGQHPQQNNRQWDYGLGPGLAECGPAEVDQGRSATRLWAEARLDPTPQWPLIARPHPVCLVFPAVTGTRRRPTGSLRGRPGMTLEYAGLLNFVRICAHGGRILHALLRIFVYKKTTATQFLTKSSKKNICTKIFM